MDDFYFQDWDSYQAQQAETTCDAKPQEPASNGLIIDPVGMGIFQPTEIKWLINGLLEADTTGVIFGASGDGKSFFLIDLMLSITTGLNFHGRKVKQGSVMYIAGEGNGGIGRRVTAWAQKHANHDLVAKHFIRPLKPDGKMILLPDDIDLIIEAAKQVPDLRLIAFDTLSRTFNPKYNPNNEMSVYTGALDEIRRALNDVVVMTVHHTGHGQADRERNGSELRANLDVSMRVYRDNDKRVCVESKKMKEGEPFEPMVFRLQKTELEGWVADDIPVTSCTLDYVSGESPIHSSTGKKLDGYKKAAMVVLNALYDAQRRNLELNGYDPDGAQVRFDDWRVSCRNNPQINERYIAPSVFSGRVSDWLEKEGLVSIKNGYVMPLDYVCPTYTK